MIPLTETREMSTNPVTTVPTIAPAVPSAESCPTTEPVSRRLLSRSLMTIGVIADSRAPGTIRANVTAIMTTPSASPPAARTAIGVSATATPDVTSNGPSTRRGGIRSASRPPDHDPKAMAANAMPITKVLVSSVNPR